MGKATTEVEEDIKIKENITTECKAVNLEEHCQNMNTNNGVWHVQRIQTNDEATNWRSRR